MIPNKNPGDRFIRDPIEAAQLNEDAFELCGCGWPEGHTGDCFDLDEAMSGETEALSEKLELYAQLRHRICNGGSRGQQEVHDKLKKELLTALAPSDPLLAATAMSLVNIQAEDEGLWFKAKTAAEAYLQQALRELHGAVEADPVEGGPVAWDPKLESRMWWANLRTMARGLISAFDAVEALVEHEDYDYLDWENFDYCRQELDGLTLHPVLTRPSVEGERAREALEGLRAALLEIKQYTSPNISPEKFIHEIARAALASQAPAQEKP